jgi:chemotaxis protein histidine kinase CheA
MPTYLYMLTVLNTVQMVYLDSIFDKFRRLVHHLETEIRKHIDVCLPQ